MSCKLELMQPRMTPPEEEPECLLAQALLCLMADAVCLLLSLHWLMFRLWACHRLLASVVKQAVDERKHLAYHRAHRKSEMSSLFSVG